MRPRSVNMASVGLASIAAGPAFLLGLALTASAQYAAEPIPFDARTLPDFLAMAAGLAPTVGLAFCIVGTIIAFPLAMTGAVLLAWLGERNVGARLPAFWALIGALSAGIPMLVFSGGWMGWFLPFAFTGAVVASICRRRIDWEA